MRFIKLGDGVWMNLEDISLFSVIREDGFIRVEIYAKAGEDPYALYDDDAESFLERISKCVAYVDDLKPDARKS